MDYNWHPLPVMLLMLILASSFTTQLVVSNPSDNLLFADDFENYPVGSFPAQWTLIFNGMGDQYQQVLFDPVDSSNKCFQMQGEENWAADAVRYFQSNSDIISFEVSVLVTATTGTTGDNVKVGFWEQVNWGSAKWNDGIAFTDNGTIVARDYVEAEGTGTVLQAYVPNQWYNIRFILDRPNKLISVYINGELKGELIRGSERGYLFQGLAVSGRYTENPVCYDNVKIFEDTTSSTYAGSQEPALTVQCVTSASLSNFKVQIAGALTYNGTGISEAPILLSYSVTGGKSWVDLTLVQTRSDGSYIAEWRPSVTGYYALKAVYDGNENYSDTLTQVNFALEPYQEQNVLSVNSNSTITGLVFDLNNSKLSFIVSGNTGTTGYVNVNIPKSLVSDVSAFAVYLDDNEVDYSVESQNESWLLSFTYHHSTHMVNISLGQSSNLSNEISGIVLVEITVLVLICVAVIGGFLFFRKKTGHKKHLSYHFLLTERT